MEYDLLRSQYCMAHFRLNTSRNRTVQREDF